MLGRRQGSEGNPSAGAAPGRRTLHLPASGRPIQLPPAARGIQLPASARNLQLPAPGARRAVVIGAGSFGTAVAVLLARGGLRTTLQTRTEVQARRLQDERENASYLPGVELPRELRIEPFGSGLGRADYVFLGVPSRGIDDVIARLPEQGLSSKAAIVSLAKGLVPPYGTPPTVRLCEHFDQRRVACMGGPAHAAEMVGAGAGLVAASTDETLASALADAFIRAGVVCEESSDPVGVELAGAAKNAAALASGATEAQGLNAAGAAAGHIFSEVWRWAEPLGARPESMIGLAGTGDLVATALAPMSRNRRAGELLSQGVSAADIPARLGQAVEALESVPLLARALASAGVEAPVTDALGKLIAGELPLDEWVAVVRTTVPPRGRWRPAMRRGLWRRLRERMSSWLGFRRSSDAGTAGLPEVAIALHPVDPVAAAPAPDASASASTGPSVSITWRADGADAASTTEPAGDVESAVDAEISVDGERAPEMTSASADDALIKRTGTVAEPTTPVVETGTEGRREAAVD